MDATASGIQGRRCRMNDEWKRIIKKWIECYESINTLWMHHIFNDNEYSNFQAALLERIVDSFKNEVEE